MIAKRCLDILMELKEGKKERRKELQCFSSVKVLQEHRKVCLKIKDK